jgi:hypothetical protein
VRCLGVHNSGQKWKGDEYKQKRYINYKKGTRYKNNIKILSI